MPAAAKKPARRKSAPARRSSARPTGEGGAARGRILDLLKRHGGQSSAALAAALDVTPMAVRLHLYEMQKEGLVRCAPVVSGRGRPTKVWALTEAADRFFPDAHQGLAVGLIRSLEGLFGAEGLSKVIARHGDRQRAAYRARLDGAKSVGERVKRLAAIRAEEGYMAEARRDGRDWLLVENHCPICSAARACMRLCANELEVFQDVLGTDVSVAREEHILAGARRCAYRISALG